MDHLMPLHFIKDTILYSLMVISFLAGIVFVIFLRTVRRDLTRYEELDKETQAQMNEELSGWKLVCGCMYFFVLLWLMLEVCFISNNMVCVRYGLFARNGINLI